MAQGQGEPGCLDPLWSPWEGHLDSPLPDLCAELPLGTGDGGVKGDNTSEVSQCFTKTINMGLCCSFSKSKLS